MILQNIWRKVVGHSPIHISPSNIFQLDAFACKILSKIIMLLFAAVSINGPNHSCLERPLK